MSPSPLEIKTCDRCASYVLPKRQGFLARCQLTGLTVCSKGKGCHYYNRSPSADPAFMRPVVTLVQQ